MDRGAGMAQQFITNWRSEVFRDKCATQIDNVRKQLELRLDSDDPMERFFAQNSTVQLEEFVFNKAKSREDYVSLVAEMVMMLRQHGGKPEVDISVLERANPSVLASAGISHSDLDRFRNEREKGEKDEK